MTKRNKEAEADMHRKGLALAGDIARAVSVSKSTVTRWADDGKVREVRYLTGRYIDVDTVVKHMGLDNQAAARLRFAVLSTEKQKQAAARKGADATMTVESTEGGSDGTDGA